MKEITVYELPENEIISIYIDPTKIIDRGELEKDLKEVIEHHIRLKEYENFKQSLRDRGKYVL